MANDKYLISSIAILIILVGVLPIIKQVSSADAEEHKPGSVIGIDLGTTYSCVGVFKDGRVDIIANDQGNRITPSYVAFTSEGERLIGDAAKNQLTTNHENTVFDVKRLIGRSWDDASVQSDLKYLPYKVLNKDNKIYIEVCIYFNFTQTVFNVKSIFVTLNVSFT